MLSAATGPFLVLGAGGLVGGELLRLAGERGITAIGRRHAECDITSPVAVTETIAGTGAAWVINCAAYNAVDRAEREAELAHAVNAVGPANVARSAPRLVHYSTDYVFDGEKPTPYVEEDPPAPLSTYARSKAAGDDAVRAENPRHLLLRVGCIYGHGSGNFGSTVLRRLRAGERIRADGERRVQPTWARRVAEQTFALVERGAPFGLYHAMCHGDTTWAEFALEVARQSGCSPHLIETVSTSSLQTAALRPRRSVLENHALANLQADVMGDWRQALSDYLQETR